jgi:hypothetical protein
VLCDTRKYARAMEFHRESFDSTHPIKFHMELSIVLRARAAEFETKSTTFLLCFEGSSLLSFKIMENSGNLNPRL